MLTLDPSAPGPPDLTDKIIQPDDGRYSEAGGFGDVYRCQYKSDDSTKEVAVKVFRFGFTVDDLDHSHHTRDKEKADRTLRRELGIWRRLSHPNIVPFLGITYGFGRRGNVSLVSLWMPHGTLRSFLEVQDSQLVIAHRLQLLLDIASGLHYLHALPMVHGDLSSNNVLIDHDCNARLTDFGCASLLGELPSGFTYLKMTTVKPGTLRWTAPEHLSLGEEESKHTSKSDIYSFGNMALLVLSGKYPWSEVLHDAAVVLCLSQGRKPGRPPGRRIDDLHWALIERCWSSIPERPLAEDLVSALQRLLASYPTPRPLRDLGISSSSGVIQSSPVSDDAGPFSFTLHTVPNAKDKSSAPPQEGTKDQLLENPVHVERSTISEIFKPQTIWMNVPKNHDKWHCTSKLPEIEEELVSWLVQMKQQDTPLTDVLIRNKAKEIAQSLQIPAERFKASSGWVKHFKHRHNIREGVWLGAHKSLRAMRGVGATDPRKGSSESSLKPFYPAFESRSEALARRDSTTAHDDMKSEDDQELGPPQDNQPVAGPSNTQAEPPASHNPLLSLRSLLQTPLPTNDTLISSRLSASPRTENPVVDGVAHLSTSNTRIHPTSTHASGRVHEAALQPSDERDGSRQRKRPKYTRSKTGCLTCRVKKIKCDETKPVCIRCAHGQRDCTWPEGASTRRKATRRGSVDRRSSTAEYSSMSGPSTPLTRGSTPPRLSQTDYSPSPATSRRHSFSSESSVPKLELDLEPARRRLDPYLFHDSSLSHAFSMIPKVPEYQPSRYDPTYNGNEGSHLLGPSHLLSRVPQLGSIAQQDQSQHQHQNQSSQHWMSQMPPPPNPTDSLFYSLLERSLVGRPSDDDHP